MIHTALTERYDLEVPFVSAGMGFIALPPLAAAISNAGGFGQLSAPGQPFDSCSKKTTSKQFCPNFDLMPAD